MKSKKIKFSNWLIGAFLLGVSLMRPTSASAVTLGQTDNFQDGTTQNWRVGLLGATHPAPPINVPNGGPNGVGDNYLGLTAVGGMGPGSKLTVINFANQWVGNYLAAGVNAISMDLNNLGATDLNLRLLFADPMMGPPTNVAVSTDSIFLQAGSGWTHVLFPIGINNLTAVSGTVTNALTNATELRLFNNPNPDDDGPAIQARLGVDNITATAVPEPSSTLSILALGTLGAASTFKRKLKLKPSQSTKKEPTKVS